MTIPAYNINTFVKRYKTNSKGEAPVYIKVIVQGQKMELSTKLFVHPIQWDSKAGRMKSGEDKNTVNAVIDKLCTGVNQSIMQLFLSGHLVTVDSLRAAIRGEELDKKPGLIAIAQEHNQQFEKLVGIKYAYGSYKNYKTTLQFLREFVLHQYKKKEVELTVVDYQFCERYFIWLTNTKTCRQNGAGKHLQRLKKLMNYALNMSYISNNPIRSYPVTLKTPPRTALTWEEIKRIQKLDLQTDRLRQVRDIFMFQTYTGLSYADVKVFSAKHLYKGVNQSLWLKMERTKTRNSFAVPLLKPAVSILERYLGKDNGGPIFPVISNQKLNVHLKIIQELAGIPKNLHSHLPRHTFATTVTLQSGVPLETVSKMLGHTKITMTQVYARVNETKIATDMKILSKKLS